MTEREQRIREFAKRIKFSATGHDQSYKSEAEIRAILREFDAGCAAQAQKAECPTCGAINKWSEATAVAAYNNRHELCHDPYHRESAACTCPTTTWIGADENDSTCKAHSEESAPEEWMREVEEVRRGFGMFELSTLGPNEFVTASGKRDGGWVVYRHAQKEK